MRRHCKMLIVSCLCVSLPLTAMASDFKLIEGDRIVLVGNTLIEREQRYGYWEAALITRFPTQNITIRNLGWSGDTVWSDARGQFGTPADGFKQLKEHVVSLKPTAEIDDALVANLVALRTVLALATGERTGPRPISNRTTMRDVAPRRDPEALMRELLRAMAQSIEELGLEDEARLMRALSAARPSERFGEQARELLALTPRLPDVFASAQAGEGEPDLALVGSFISQARSLLSV